MVINAPSNKSCASAECIRCSIKTESEPLTGSTTHRQMMYSLSFLTFFFSSPFFLSCLRWNDLFFGWGSLTLFTPDVNYTTDAWLIADAADKLWKNVNFPNNRFADNKYLYSKWSVRNFTPELLTNVFNPVKYIKHHPDWFNIPLAAFLKVTC